MLTVMWLTGVTGGIIYVFYLFPWELLDLVSPVPRDIFRTEGFLAFCTILALPAALYSVIFGLAVLFLKNMLARKSSGLN
jgi:hypothetical protein